MCGRLQPICAPARREALRRCLRKTLHTFNCLASLHRSYSSFSDADESYVIACNQVNGNSFVWKSNLVSGFSSQKRFNGLYGKQKLSTAHTATEHTCTAASFCTLLYIFANFLIEDNRELKIQTLTPTRVELRWSHFDPCICAFWHLRTLSSLLGSGTLR